jgi:hypothetical protein
MKKQGYRPSTTRSCVNTLKAVAKKAELLDPEAVKTDLASANVTVGGKEKICQDPARLTCNLVKPLLRTMFWF